MVIRPAARRLPIQRMESSIGPLSCAKTCSTPARTFERVAVPRRMCLGIGLPRGFLRWMWERNPLAFSQASLRAERYPVSAQTLPERLAGSRIVASSWPS